MLLGLKSINSSNGLVISCGVSKSLVAHSAELHDLEILQKHARCSMAQLHNSEVLQKPARYSMAQLHNLETVQNPARYSMAQLHNFEILQMPAQCSMAENTHSINQCIVCTSPEVIKLFSCSTQLNTKFQLLNKTKIQTNQEICCFKPLRCCIYRANKC